jgi:tellurite resistance protein
VQFALAAYTVFMVLVQIRLIPQYRQVPFGPTFWAFTFSYASAATYGMHWLSLDPVPGGVVVAWFLALGMTGFIGWIAVRSIALMRAGRYFPSRQPELTS